MRLIKLNTFNGDSKTKAFFDIQTSEGFIITGFRIVQGEKGMFVSSPREKRRDGKYYDTTVVPPEMKKELEKLALDEYHKSHNN